MAVFLAALKNMILGEHSIHAGCSTIINGTYPKF
jgi:hypothetical protein